MRLSHTAKKGGTTSSPTGEVGSGLSYPGSGGVTPIPPLGDIILLVDGVSPMLMEDGVSPILLESTAPAVITPGAYNGASVVDNSGYATANAVTDFGADPTGVADSYAALMNFLNCAGSAVDLFLPDGTYRCSKYLLMNGKSNRILRANGNDKVTLRMTSELTPNNDSAVQFVNCSHLRIQDFKVYAPNTTARQLSGNRGYGLYGESCVDVTVRNMILQNIPAGSCLFTKSTDIQYLFNTATGGWADGFHFTGPGTARCLAQYNQGIALGDDAFAAIAYTGYQLDSIQFLDNEAHDCYWSNGYHFTGVTNGKILRNKSYNNAMGGVEVTTDAAYSNSNSDNIEIANNYIEGAVTRGASTGHASIYCYTGSSGGNLTNISVHDNVVNNPFAGAGLKTMSAAGGAVSVTADNNTFTNTTGGMSAPVSVGAGTTLLYTGRGNTFNGAPL